jgi:riboflavin synthase
VFTGLVESLGRLQGRDNYRGGARLVISTGESLLEGLREGDSIAVNGVCLTAEAVAKSSFTAVVMPETLRKTNLGQVRPGEPLNLERALPLGGRLGGHLVSGHVDATGTLVQRRPEGNALILQFKIPPELMRYIIPKGSVAVDGVSLTVAGLHPDGFSVSLIPLTAERTTLGWRKMGDAVNIEVDLIGKYVDRLLQPYLAGKVERRKELTAAFLEEMGFI